jgi:hypothetical protein
MSEAPVGIAPVAARSSGTGEITNWSLHPLGSLSDLCISLEYLGSRKGRRNDKQTMIDVEERSGRRRVAIVEENNYHAETVFAFACSASTHPGECDLTVFAPDPRLNQGSKEYRAWEGAREFLLEDLQISCTWNDVREFRQRRSIDPPFDLVIVNTFPPPGGQQAIEIALSAGEAALGLVHDIHFFGDPGGAQSVLKQYANLWLAHAGVAASEGARRLPIELQRRIVRFFPVFRFISPPGSQGADDGFHRRVGVALPGTIEFSRRDYATALRLTAETGVPLKIFGRGSGWAKSVIERRRLSDEIAACGVPPGDVSVSVDVSCRDFYRSVDRSRFVALMTVNPEYLVGKLTGAVSAAVSCGVPMLARSDVHAHYVQADPAVFGRCMVPFDPHAPAGRGDSWGSLVGGMPLEIYEELCRETSRARETLLEENARTIARARSSCRTV